MFNTRQKFALIAGALLLASQAHAGLLGDLTQPIGNLLNPEPVQVPEPGTLGLFGLAIAGVALARKRRSHNTKK